MGLKQRIIDAKVQALQDTGVTKPVDTKPGSYIEREAQYISEAVLETIQEANFTITQLKAPVVVESMKTPDQPVNIELETLLGEYQPVLKLLHKIGSGSYNDTWKGNADGSRIQATYWTYGNTGENWAAPICFLHSPGTTEAITYKWQWTASTGGYTIYINRTYNDTAYQGCTVSNIVLSEIGA